MVFGDSRGDVHQTDFRWASIISATTPDVTPAAMLVPFNRRYLFAGSLAAVTRALT